MRPKFGLGLLSARFDAGLLTPPKPLTEGLSARPVAIKRPTKILSIFLAAIIVCALADDSAAEARLRGALLTAEMATAEKLQSLKADGYNAIALVVKESEPAAVAADRTAAERIARAGLEMHYWIEVGRSPELADAHPLWMASLQGHHEWRRLHKELPHPRPGEVVKCYPWTPVLYREVFDAQLARVKKLLADRLSPATLFLNDLQGPPSACGCGNPVCRWTTDYGPIVTAARLGDDAAAKFVAEVQKIAGGQTRVVPVWASECEEHDKELDALCAGVGCYKGTCWKVYTRQLAPLAAEADAIGALLLYKEFQQDRPYYKQPAGWTRHALVHGFVEQPAKNGGPKVEPSRLIAVLQGWDVSQAEIAAQIDHARAAGAAGYVVALAKIDQSWTPKIVKWR